MQHPNIPVNFEPQLGGGGYYRVLNCLKQHLNNPEDTFSGVIQEAV